MSIISNKINLNSIIDDDFDHKPKRNLRKKKAEEARKKTLIENPGVYIGSTLSISEKSSTCSLKRCDKDENKRYKTRDEISFLEQQLLSDPSWSRKTVQHCKKVLGMKTEQIYKWGYDRKKAITKYKKLFPESNGFKTRFSNFNKEIDPNNLNEVVGSILDSMKHYRVFTKPKEEKEKCHETDPSLDTESVKFHFDENDDLGFNFCQKSNCWDDYSSEVIGLNEQSLRLSTHEYFDEEVYMTLNKDNYF